MLSDENSLSLLTHALRWDIELNAALEFQGKNDSFGVKKRGSSLPCKVMLYKSSGVKYLNAT